MLQFFPVGNKAARNQFLAATVVLAFAIVVIGNLRLVGINFSLGGTTAETNAKVPGLLHTGLLPGRMSSWRQVFL